VFEGVLYFVLGFLASALIALMISPAIWNRAVVLTKKRIESSVPLTLNEVQADKDQLRAEFAMSTRRLELSIDELKDKASRQVIEINRKRDELAKLSHESSDKVRTVEELEARGSELRSQLLAREEALAAASEELRLTKQQLEERALELEKMGRTLNETKSEADSRRIELVAKQTSLDDLTDRSKTFKTENETLLSEIRKLSSQLASEQDKSEEVNSRLERLKKSHSELEEKLQRREKDVSEIRATSRSEDDSSNELTKLLMEERKKVTALEAKMSQTTLRMEALLADASNENVSKAVETVNADKAELRKSVKALKAENTALNKEIKAYRDNSGSEWEVERKENAVLRERINDLAAQVTAMTAALEGPASPINEILKKAETTPKKNANSNGNGDSLADRVRALQESARIKEA